MPATKDATNPQNTLHLYVVGGWRRWKAACRGPKGEDIDPIVTIHLRFTNQLGPMFMLAED